MTNVPHWSGIVDRGNAVSLVTFIGNKANLIQ